MPAVSVIMPCYNHASFLRASAESVLSQSLPDLELIIVDDLSADNSVEVAQDLARQDSRVRVVAHRKNLGVSRSRNDGLQLAKGDFIAFCDADDVWLPEKLSIQVEALRRHSQYDAAYSDAIIIDEKGAATGRYFSKLHPPPSSPDGRLFAHLCLRNFINTQTVVIRRKCLESAGGFDGKIKFGEDWWFWIQLSRKHLFLYFKERLGKYRVHGQSTNVTHRRRYPAHRFKVFHRMLKAYPDLSDESRCQIWYHMGCCLRQLGRRKWARACFRRALSLSVHHWRAVRHGARPLIRLAY